MGKVVRLKKPASEAPQTRDQVAADIAEIGYLQRQQARVVAELNDGIAQLTQAAQPALDEYGARINALQDGVQTWCEAHRDELTRGRTKTANLVTGEVSWRQRPPSVRVRALEAVLGEIRARGLAGLFIRTKDEINKEAVLAAHDQVADIPGLQIVSGVEDFVITPFEQTTAA